MIIRTEEKNDDQAIEQLLLNTFKDHPYSHNTEHQMVKNLRQDNAITLALVVEHKDEIIGLYCIQ